MAKILTEILNMSFYSSIVACIVILIRIPLKKAPKCFSYALWFVVFFKLIYPLQFESPLGFFTSGMPSVVPPTIRTVPANQMEIKIQAVPKPITIAPRTNPQNNIVQNPTASPIKTVFAVATVIWFLGFVALMIYALISYIHMKKHIYDATLAHGNIFVSDKICTAFVLGFVNPQIYIPTSVTQAQSEYILKHEQVHIKRLDYLIKPVAFLIVSIHWFNPVVWISYFLMAMDMEMSCDEAVLQNTDEDIRQAYSISLVNLYAREPGLLSPLAFGESSFKNMKMRVKNVLNFKKTPKWAIAVCSLILVILVVGFTTTSQAQPRPSGNKPTDIQSGNSDYNKVVKNTAKDITIEIEKIVQNNHMVRVHYVVEDKQNSIGDFPYAQFSVNNQLDSNISRMIKREDGNYYGTFYYFTQAELEENMEIQIARLSHQINGQERQIDIQQYDVQSPKFMTGVEGFDAWKEEMIRINTEYFGHEPEAAEYYRSFQFLQPDVYNQMLPAPAGEGDVWLSNIGIVNNELRLQIKTLNFSTNSEDGIYATDLPTVILDQGREEQSMNEVGRFYMREDGRIEFEPSDTYPQQYIVIEFAYELGQQDINTLELYLFPIFQSIINGPWAVPLDGEQLTQSITLDLTGIELLNRDSTGVLPGEFNDKVMLEKLTITPLYYELSFEREVKDNHAFNPTVVITYRDGSKTELAGFIRIFEAAGNTVVNFAGDERTRPYELIDVDNIRSITVDNVEVFDRNR